MSHSAFWGSSSGPAAPPLPSWMHRSEEPAPSDEMKRGTSLPAFFVPEPEDHGKTESHPETDARARGHLHQFLVKDQVPFRRTSPPSTPPGVAASAAAPSPLTLPSGPQGRNLPPLGDTQRFDSCATFPAHPPSFPFGPPVSNMPAGGAHPPSFAVAPRPDPGPGAGHGHSSPPTSPPPPRPAGPSHGHFSPPPAPLPSILPSPPPSVVALAARPPHPTRVMDDRMWSISADSTRSIRDSFIPLRNPSPVPAPLIRQNRPPRSVARFIPSWDRLSGSKTNPVHESVGFEDVVAVCAMMQSPRSSGMMFRLSNPKSSHSSPVVVVLSSGM